MQHRYLAQVIHPDSAARLRLKTIACNLAEFSTIRQSADLKDAHNATNGESVDVYFISSRFEQEEIKQFTAQTKSTNSGSEAAFVLLLDGSKQDRNTLTQNVLLGLDGFLCEPYSVDGLLEITRIAAKIKLERHAAKEKFAFSLLVREIGGQIDLIATLLSQGAKAALSRRALEETCSILPTLSEESATIYTEVVLAHFENAQPPTQAVKRKAYSGASQRVQQIQESKMLASLKQECTQLKRQAG